MNVRLRKWVAEQYDQRGSLTIARQSRYVCQQMRFHLTKIHEIAELRHILSVLDTHHNVKRREKENNACMVTISRRKDVFELCTLIYPYLQNEDKKKKMREAWHKLGWCICNDEL